MNEAPQGSASPVSAGVQVEVYDALEHEEMALVGIDDDSKALIESMKLEGQQELITPEKKTLRPYNALTNEQVFICQKLFASCEAIENYSAGPIPYRVLKEAANAKGYLPHLYVFHDAALRIKDPILVGSKEKIYTSSLSKWDYEKMSLIARWGSSLEPWEKLYDMAVKKFTETALADFAELKLKVEHAMQMLREGVKPSNSNYNYDGILERMPFEKG